MEGIISTAAVLLVFAFAIYKAFKKTKSTGSCQSCQGCPNSLSCHKNR